MTPDAVLVVQRLTEFCHEKWEEAHNAPDAVWPTPDMLTGKKMAYNDVLQFRRILLDEGGRQG